MRTTINLPDGLVEHAKVHAAASGRTFTSLVEEGLRVLLDQQRHEADAQPDPLPAYGEPSGHVLIDLADRDAVWAALDDGPAR
ncbi:MAG: CopG family transcriptional regulator [Pseudonocardiaceae bacterium]|nr:CopG family transcriptional regulator [Pseudonocardiaceae bacterium]